MEFDVAYFIESNYLDKVEIELERAIKFKFPHISGLIVNARFGIIKFDDTEYTEEEVSDFIFQLQKHGLDK